MQTGGEGFISKVSVPKLQMELQSLDLAHGRPKEIYTGCKHLQTQSSACYLFFYSTFCNVTGLQKDPQRTTKYKQHTSEKTPEIRSSMKQHHHLRTPTPFCTSVSSKQRYESLHPPPTPGGQTERIQASRFPKTKKGLVSLTPVLGWIASNVSELEHPKTFLSPLRVWQSSPSCLSPGMWTMHTTGKMIAV